MKRLKMIRDKQLCIDRLYERIMRLRSAVEYTPHINRQGGGGSGANDPMGDKIALYCDLLNEYAAEECKMRVMMDEAEEFLSQFDSTTQEILRCRYYDALSWKEVAKKMNYSEDHCKRKHGQALKMTHNATFTHAIM